MKRLFDMITSLIGLIVFTPLLFLISILLKTIPEFGSDGLMAMFVNLPL